MTIGTTLENCIFIETHPSTAWKVLKKFQYIVANMGPIDIAVGDIIFVTAQPNATCTEEISAGLFNYLDGMGNGAKKTMSKFNQVHNADN